VYRWQNRFVVNRNRIEYHKTASNNLDNRNRVEYHKTASNDLDDRTIKKKPYHINLSKPEASNYIHITFVSLKHNHDININNMRFALVFQKFNESVMSEIEHTVVYGRCDAYTIRNLLQP
ncbi:4474_t:CDS:2, partial [Racocetra persica]